uniref:Uncharacterized protein n=1 Tax=Panagrellus redivivus TaxID=6233 RepID=A0A7E4VM52_PANRE
MANPTYLVPAEWFRHRLHGPRRLLIDLDIFMGCYQSYGSTIKITKANVNAEDHRSVMENAGKLDEGGSDGM